MLLYDKYLFEEADDMILGYLMTPKDNDIREYRKKELEPIITDSGIFEAVSNCSIILQNIIKDNEKSVSCYDLISTTYDYWGDNGVHIIKKDSDLSHSKETINRYYNGDYTNAYAVIIRHRFDYPTISLPTDFLLLTEDKYDTTLNNFFHSYSNYKMSGIIPITESLYYLQQLENGHFEKIDNYDIEEQLRLFDYKKEPSVIISKREFKDLLHCDLIQQDAYDDAIKKVNKSQKVLKLVRDYNL